MFGGAAEQAAEAQQQLLLNPAVAAVGIILWLTIVFPSWRNLLLLLGNVPFALVGGVLAVSLSDNSAPGKTR